MKQTIAVIGATEGMGSAVAYRLAAAGYCVLLTDDSDKHLTRFFAKLPLLLAKIRLEVPRAEVRIVFSAREACWEADIIIFAVSSEDQAEVAQKIKDVVTRKIVVGATDSPNKTHNGLGTGSTATASVGLSQLLPYSKIVKAYCTNSSEDLGRPWKAGPTANVLVAGEDQEAVSTIMQIVNVVGLDPVITSQTTLNCTVRDWMYHADPSSGLNRAQRIEKFEGTAEETE